MQADGGDLKNRISGTDYKISALTSSVTCTEETDDTCVSTPSFPLGQWGYRLSNETAYNAVSTTEPQLLNESKVAAGSSITKIYFASRMDHSTPAGTYAGVKLSFTATTNVVTYNIYYHKGNDEVPNGDVTGLQNDPQYGELNSNGMTDVEITAVDPVRKNYTFKGWCTAKPTTDQQTLTDSCTGTDNNGVEAKVYHNGDTIEFSPIESPTVLLYAMWDIVTPNITFTLDKGIAKVTASGKFADGSSAKSVEADDTTGGTSGAIGLMAGQDYTITAEPKVGYSLADTDAIKKIEGGGTLTDGNFTPSTAAATIALASKPNTYEVTFGTVTGISSISLGGQNCTTALPTGCKKTLAYDESYNLVATAATGYSFTSWTQSGANGTIADTTNASTTFKPGVGATTITPGAEVITRQVTIKPGTGIWGVQLDSNDVCTNTSGCAYNLAPDSEHTLKASPATSGYALSTWSKSGSGTLNDATSPTATKFTVGTAAATLTAIGKTVANKCPDTTYTDNRGTTQTYAIATLADGNCWILENLRLGDTFAIELTNEDTNLNTISSYTISASEKSGFMDAAGRINIQSMNKTGDGGYKSGKYGVYYDFCAASAGTVCGTENTAEVQDNICPKGWRIPSQAEYSIIWNAYGNIYAGFVNAIRAPLSGDHTSSVTVNQAQAGSSGPLHYIVRAYVPTTPDRF